MASDNADQVTIIHALATSQTLRRLVDTRFRLETILADAPFDATATITTATQDLESPGTRRQLWSAAGRNERLIATIERAITRTQTRLTGALDAQERRVDWFEDHIDTVNEYDQTRRAVRHRRSKITENPHRYLPDDVVSNMAPEPVSQGGRRIWHAALVQRALSHDKTVTHGIVIVAADQVVAAAIDDPGIDLM